MIAIIGTSDRPCWLAEACKILLLLLLLSLLLRLILAGKGTAKKVATMQSLEWHHATTGCKNKWLQCDVCTPPLLLHLVSMNA